MKWKMEIWNFKNPMFGFDPVYFGKGLAVKSLASYGASFGNRDITDKIPTDISKPQQPESPSGDTDDDDEDEEENLYKYQLDASQKAMIEKRKLQAEKERKLGEKIIEEQNGNIKSKN